MDSAIQVVNMASAVHVTAQDINDFFHGDIPESVRFYCPFCSRPVNPNAMGYRFDRMRQNPLRRTRKTKDPYFSHRKNDEWSHTCEDYHANNTVITDDMALPLLMFLRKEKESNQFRVEFALRRRGLLAIRHSLTQEDTITVDNTDYSILDLISSKDDATIVLPNPLFDVESRVQIPQQWQVNIGRVQNDTDIMLFSDTFGRNGGRRLAYHSSIHTNCMYYIVSTEERLHRAKALFTRMSYAGHITGNDQLSVYSFLVSSSSTKKNRIDDWLGQYGYCLSDFDHSAQLIWPPSLRSWGVDEPLFKRSSPIYRFPYLSGNKPMPDMIAYKRLLPKEKQARSIGLIGFDETKNIVSESASYCVFFKPQPRMPWNTAYVGPRYPDDLHPYNEWTTNDDDNDIAEPIIKNKISSANTEKFTDADISRLPLNQSVEIALRRRGFDIGPKHISRSVTIAQTRERGR